MGGCKLQAGTCKHKRLLYLIISLFEWQYIFIVRIYQISHQHVQIVIVTDIFKYGARQQEQKHRQRGERTENERERGGERGEGENKSAKESEKKRENMREIRQTKDRQIDRETTERK